MALNKHNQLDVRFVGKFTEKQLNDWLQYFHLQGKQITKLIVTQEQEDNLRSFMPDLLEDFETGELVRNPVKKPVAKNVKTVKVYESDVQTVIIDVHE